MALTEKQQQHILWAFDVAVGSESQVRSRLPEVTLARLELALALADDRVRNVTFTTSANGQYTFIVIADPEPSDE